MKIVFITNNKHKLGEIKNIPGKDFEIVSLVEIGCREDIPETGATLEESTRQKSSYVVKHYGQSCFADNTGLGVGALGGESDVHLTRHTKGTDHDSEADVRKLLANLEGKASREVYFRTITSLTTDGVEHQFEGKVEGRIAAENHRTEGFGYDPIFVPEGYDKSSAEFGEEIKNQISHRTRTVKESVEYLGRLEG